MSLTSIMLTITSVVLLLLSCGEEDSALSININSVQELGEAKGSVNQSFDFDSLVFDATVNTLAARFMFYGLKLEFDYYYSSTPQEPGFSGFENPAHLLNALMVVPNQRAHYALFRQKSTAPKFPMDLDYRQTNPATFSEKFFRLQSYFQPEASCLPDLWVVTFFSVTPKGEEYNYLVCESTEGGYLLSDQSAVTSDMLVPYSFKKPFVEEMNKPYSFVSDRYKKVHALTRIDDNLNESFTAFDHTEFIRLCEAGKFAEICKDNFNVPIPFDIVSYYKQ